MEDERTRKRKLSRLMYGMIFIMTVFATIIMFSGYQFMKSYDVGLESTRLGMFRFFTVDANLFMGIVSLIFMIEETKVLKGKQKEIPRLAYLLNLMSTTAVTLTFTVVFLYLGPISKYGIKSMITNSNLFFHLLIPLLSILNFIFIEENEKLEKKDTIYGMLPTIIYALYYLINVLIHMENGKVSPIYDWYWFIQNGVWTAIIVIPIIFLLTYMIAITLYIGNKKIRIDRKK